MDAPVYNTKRQNSGRKVYSVCLYLQKKGTGEESTSRRKIASRASTRQDHSQNLEDKEKQVIGA